jgi:hypothetical protein
MGAQVHIGNCAFDSFRMYPGVVRFGFSGDARLAIHGYVVTSAETPQNPQAYSDPSGPTHAGEGRAVARARADERPTGGGPRLMLAFEPLNTSAEMAWNLSIGYLRPEVRRPASYGA